MRGYWGLSPRVRGNLDAVATTKKVKGTIPARTGEPAAAFASLAAVRDYPRACGGTGLAFLVCYRSTGLSPRVRGNRAYCTTSEDGTGTIPARTGEPETGQPAHTLLRDYPRAYGGTRSVGEL